MVYTNRQVFRDNVAATGTALCGASGVHAHDATTSVFSFVRGEVYELSPGDISNVTVDDLVAVGLHL